MQTDKVQMMEQQSAEVTWQENKTPSERICYMFENEIATDVCFEFRSPDGSVSLVRAHKLILLFASPVFESMFTGSAMNLLSELRQFLKSVFVCVFKVGLYRNLAPVPAEIWPFLTEMD